MSRTITPSASKVQEIARLLDGHRAMDNPEPLTPPMPLDRHHPGGLEALFRANPQVCVAGDWLWYPVEGHPESSTAPDVLVAVGRPKGDRGAYLPWEEGGITPQVVSATLAPGKTVTAMTCTLRLYERYGVAEYALYYPEAGKCGGWQRQGATLEEIAPMAG